MERAECVKFSASQGNIIIVRIARSKIRGKIKLQALIDRGESCFQICTSSLSHSPDLNFILYEMFLSPYLLSRMCGFRNLNFSTLLAYGKNRTTKQTNKTPKPHKKPKPQTPTKQTNNKEEKKKVLYLKFLENLRSHSTSNSWRVIICGSPVKLSNKSIFQF